MIVSDKGKISVKGNSVQILVELKELISSLLEEFREEHILRAIIDGIKDNTKTPTYKINTSKGKKSIKKQLMELEVPEDLIKQILKEMN